MQETRNFRKKFIFPFVGLISFIIFPVLVLFSWFGDDSLRIWFLDVGQGDAILIQTPGKKQVLIDGGPGKDTNFLLSRYLPFWDRKIEAIFLTHPDADHSNGLIEILKTYDVDNFYSSFYLFQAKDFGENTDEINELKRLVKKRKSSGRKICGLKQAAFDKIELWLFWPLCDKETLTENRNSSSLAILLRYEEFEALFLGDLPNNYQNQLSVANYFQNIEVVKIAHHGAKNGMNKGLLEKTQPGVAVISAGKNNRFGHPHEETLKTLKELNIVVKRTDENGTVEVVVNKKGYRIETER